MTLENPPCVETQMLIRCPVEEVFEAFVDPWLTTKFWFTASTGRVEAGSDLTWEWEMYGVSAPVHVKEVEPNRRILVEWGDPPSCVEWQFEARKDGTTLVKISNWGFPGSDDEAVAAAIDSMGGFATMLAGAKAYLERGLQLGLVEDHFPDNHVSSVAVPVDEV